MKFYILYILLFIFISCSRSSDLEFTVRKDKVIFHNWTPKEIHNKIAAIYLWDKKEQKLSKTIVQGVFRYNQENILEFVPSFPLLEDTEYVLMRNVEGKKKQVHFSLPYKKKESLQVVSVYPTSNELPENLLRMYIQFSQPMKTIGNLENIKLINEHGKEIEGAIFNNVYELWDSSQKQLTIIFDPSRVKTDLVANKNLGRALQPNKKFHLKIDTAEDIYGEKLQQPFIKTFLVTPQDTVSPNTKSWELSIPKHNSKDFLQLIFQSALDRMSLLSRIKVVDELDKEVKGKISIHNNEMQWQFTPDEPWKKGGYSLLVNSRLEDPSGNNLNGLFDHKIGSLKNEQEGEIIKMFFKI